MTLGEQLDLKPILEKLDKLPGIQRMGVLGVVFLAVIGIYWFTLYGGKRDEYRIVQGQLTQLQTKIAETRSVVSNLKSFEQTRETLRKELDRALRRLPNAQELPVLLTDITSLGKKSGLEFRSFRPKGEVDRGFYAEVPIEIELRGRYHDLGVFFDRVSRLSRIVNVNELDLKLADRGSNSPVLNVKGTAVTFRFKDPSANASAGGE
ncbi:MAG: type 4a pilus biogenesis protein PilO [Myxococcota bacterium]